MTVWKQIECKKCGAEISKNLFYLKSFVCKKCSSKNMQTPSNNPLSPIKNLNKTEKRDISVYSSKAVSQFIFDFLNLINSLYTSRDNLIILCIGSDRSTGDALGPLIGSKLAVSPIFDYPLYGTLEKPVHAVNLKTNLERIKKNYTRNFIVAIDASLGDSSRIGTISLKQGPLKPGSGVHKNLPAVGEITITGIVNISGFMEFQILQSTRLHLIMKMVSIISKGLIHSLNKNSIHPLNNTRSLAD